MPHHDLSCRVSAYIVLYCSVLAWLGLPCPLLPCAVLVSSPFFQVDASGNYSCTLLHHGHISFQSGSLPLGVLSLSLPLFRFALVFCFVFALSILLSFSFIWPFRLSAGLCLCLYLCLSLTFPGHRPATRANWRNAYDFQLWVLLSSVCFVSVSGGG